MRTIVSLVLLNCVGLLSINAMQDDVVGPHDYELLSDDGGGSSRRQGELESLIVIDSLGDSDFEAIMPLEEERTCCFREVDCTGCGTHLGRILALSCPIILCGGAAVLVMVIPTVGRFLCWF